MIIAIIIVGILLYFIFNIIPMFPGSKILGYLGLLIAFLGGLATVAHVSTHWGMELKTTTKTVKIKSVSDQLSLLTYQKLGTGSEKVYIYKDANNKQKHTQTATNTTNKTKTISGTTAKLVVSEKRWEFKNSWYKTLFGVMDLAGRLDSRTNTFELPSSWYTMSTTQVQKFAKLMKQNNSAIKKAIQNEVKTKMMAAYQQNPKMTKKQLTTLQTKLAQQASAQQVAKYAKLAQQ